MSIEKRLKHCYWCGKVMEWYAREVLKRDEEYCQDMFVLGYSHDSCKDFEEYDTSIKYNHPEVISRSLDGYKYCDVLEVHDVATPELMDKSAELALLTFADLIVDGNGDVVGVAGRLKDVATRYGEGSEAYYHMKNLSEYLLSKGYNDADVLSNISDLEALCITAPKNGYKQSTR